MEEEACPATKAVAKATKASPSHLVLTAHGLVFGAMSATNKMLHGVCVCVCVCVGHKFS